MYHRTQWYLLLLLPVSHLVFGSEVHEHFNNIWQHYVSKRFACLLMKKIWYSNISHRLTCIIAFIHVDYIRQRRFGMNIALNKHQKHCFKVCHEWVYFILEWGGMESFWKLYIKLSYLPIIYFDLRYNCHLDICITNTR